MCFDLDHRVALVTGASSGIGRAAAMMLAEEGAQLLVTGRNVGRLEEVANVIEQRFGRPPVQVAADLSGSAGVQDVIAASRELSVDVDIVVNNAGESVPIVEGRPERWAQALATQFTAVREITESLLPRMRNRGWGRVINVGGTLEPPDRVNGSTVAKAAVLAWAKSLSREVGPYGITVNTVVPGRIKTRQIMERLHKDPSEREKFAKANIPLGFFGEPEDVSNLICFLASTRARYITGEVIHVDGGMRRFGF